LYKKQENRGKKFWQIFLYRKVYRYIFIYVEYDYSLFIDMKPLDPSFFNMFDYSDGEDLERAGVIESLKDYLEHPYLLFGSVIRGVENFYIIREMYTRHYKEEFERVEENVKSKYFNRLYHFLERFDENDDDFIAEAKRFEIPESSYALISLRSYFESIEEYEKCAKIQSIFTKLSLDESCIYDF